MLPIQKNNQINAKLVIAIQRLKKLNTAKQSFFNYLIKMNTLQKTHAKKIWSSMTQFQQNIVKLTFYSSQKVKMILSFIKIYRQFSIHWQKISKVNIRNLQQLSNNQIETHQKLVKQKSHLFQQQLKKYINDQNTYNQSYQTYKNICTSLKQDIEKFKSYSDPLCFYNQKFTNQYSQKLMKKFDNCTLQETKLKTQIQMLDQKRLSLSQTLSQVKQAYVPTVDKILKLLYTGIRDLIDPSKDQGIQKQDFKFKRSEGTQDRFYTGQVQNLLNNQSKTNQENQEMNIFQDFKQLFKNDHIIKAQITTDQKFFYDRCQNIKSKKIKRSNQIISIQKLLISELKMQIVNLKKFQLQFKKIQKQTFGCDGEQTYSKKFRKYFGKNFHQLYELCILITQKRKSSIQKIYKVIQSCEQKLQSAFKQKKQTLRFFQSRCNIILEAHKKIKLKVQSDSTASVQQVNQYKINILSSMKQFKKCYNDLQNYQNQMDKVFFKGLQQISDLILKQAINKSLSKIIQKEKNRMEIFKQIKLVTEAQTNFYQDPKYQIFFSQQIQSNLFKNFKSQVNTKQFQQTKNTLKQKQYTLNGMIKHRTTCCGVKSQPYTKNLKQSFECYLINIKTNKSKFFGNLNILSNGINFSQKSYNPFKSVLQIIIPSKDIDSYKIQIVQQIEVLSLTTKKGPLYFYGNQTSSIFNSLLKNLGVRPLQKQLSQKNGKNGSSFSSFLGNSRTQSFRIQFQKSTSSSIHRLQNMGSPSKLPLQKKASKMLASQIFSSNQMLKSLQIKLMKQKYLSQNFKIIEKQMPIKDNTRFNYNYKNGLHKYLLKQKKRSSIDRNILSFDYIWKISFPQNVMLKSFKHQQKVYVQLQKSQVKIRILHAVTHKNVSLAQKIFYDEIQSMNQKLTAFIVNFTQREGNIEIQEEKQSEMQSQFQIDADDIVVNFQKQASNLRTQKNGTTGQNFYKNTKLQRSASNFTSISNKNTKE